MAARNDQMLSSMWLSERPGERGAGGGEVSEGRTRVKFSERRRQTPAPDSDPSAKTRIRLMPTHHLARNTANQLQGRLAALACRATQPVTPQKHLGGPALTEPCHAVAFGLVCTKAQARRPLPAAAAAAAATPRPPARFEPRLRSCRPGAAPSPPPASAAPMAVSEAVTATAAGVCSARGGCSGRGRGGHGRDGGAGEALKRRQHVVVVVIVAVAPPRRGHRGLARAATATATAAIATAAATPASGVAVSERARLRRGC